MDNDKQDQGVNPASPDRFGNSLNAQPQPFQPDGTAGTMTNPVNPTPPRFAPPPIDKPKKSPRKIIIAISLILVLVVSGMVAWLYLNNPRRIVRKALEDSVAQTDRVLKYRATINPKPSSEKYQNDFVTAYDNTIVHVHSAILEGEISRSGQKKQGGGTTDIIIIYEDDARLDGKEPTPLGQARQISGLQGVDIATKLGKVDLVSNDRNEIYVKAGDNLLENYFRLTKGFVMQDDRIKERFGSADSDIKARALANIIRLRKKLLAVIDVIPNQWIKLDSDKLKFDDKCTGRLIADLIQPETDSKLIKIIMESKLLDIKVVGTEDKGITTYQIKLNPDAWADVAKQLAKLDSLRGLHECTQGKDMKKLLSWSDPTIKLRIKKSSLLKYQVTEYNITTKPFRLPGNKGLGAINLTIKPLEKKPEIVTPTKSMTLEQAEKRVNQAARLK